jgi:hypothetical protein
MVTAIAELEVVLHRLGVDPESATADDVARLLASVSDEFRYLTKRDFDSEPTVYTEIVRLTEYGELWLSHTPVQSLTSLARLRYDNTPIYAFALTDYHIEDAHRGLVLLHPQSWGLGYGYGGGYGSSYPYGRQPGQPYRDRFSIVYSTTGEIEQAASQAVEDWVAARWAQRSHPDSSLTSYSTGSDSESYDRKAVGPPPLEVVGVIASLSRQQGGGVI